MRLPWLAVGAVGVALGLGALAVALGPGALSTHAGRSPLAATVAALALAAAAVAAAAGPAGPRVALLALAASFCWTASVWFGWSDGPPLVRALGALTAPFLVPVVALWVVGTTGGRWRRTGRALVAVAVLAALVSGVGHAVFDDPLDDPDCWANCIVNVFLVRSEPGVVADLDRVVGLLLITVGAGLVVVSLAAWWVATGPARRAQWPVLAGGVATGVALIAHEVLAADRPEKPSDAGYHAVYLALACGMVLLAGGPVLSWLRGAAQRRAVSRLAAELGEAPPAGTLEQALARAVGDPGLRIAYWMPSAERFVDGHGHTVELPEADSTGELTTTLTRNGQTLASVRHVAAVTEAVRQLGAGTELALDNERLRAALLSQAEDIRSSRERIVATSDIGRQRLERNLHDGAQQRLLALSYRLRLAHAAAREDGDGEAEQRLGAAVEESLRALEELRTLAHGIYPAVLTESGLEAALADLADTAAVPVSIEVAVQGRVPRPVERTAYVVVTEAVHDAVERGATEVDVGVGRDEDRVVITVDDDASPRTATLLALTDRVGALGGLLRVDAHTLRAELPCG